MRLWYQVIITGMAMETVNSHFTFREHLPPGYITKYSKLNTHQLERSQNRHVEEECNCHKYISRRQSYDQWC